MGSMDRVGMKKALCTEIQSAFKFGGTSGGRTHDKRIKSPLLYQLSYGPFARVGALQQVSNYSVIFSPSQE
jgi:hypothetical protein